MAKDSKHSKGRHVNKPIWWLGWAILFGVSFIALVGTCFKSADSTMVNVSKPVERHNLKLILDSYISYHNQHGGIFSDFEGNPLINTSSKFQKERNGTNHDWAAVLAKYDNDMNDPKLWILHGDRSFVRRENRNHRAKAVFRTDENKTSLDPAFKKSILGFNVFGEIKVPDGLEPSKVPVIYTAGLQADGRWHKNSPRRYYGGHIGFLDGTVKHFKKIREGDFFKWDEPTVPTLDLREAVNGVPLRHDGIDPFDGHRMEQKQ